MKKLLFVLCIMTGITGLAMADFGDSFTITCAPTGERGVIIATDTVALGDISVGGSKTTSAIPTLSTGTVANIEYTIQGSVDGGAALTADADITPVSTEILLQAKFNLDDTLSWAATDVVTTSAQDVGNLNADAGTPGFEGTADMDNLGLLAARDLYCRVSLPANVSYSGTQTITVTVTAEQAD